MARRRKARAEESKELGLSMAAGAVYCVTIDQSGAGLNSIASQLVVEMAHEHLCLQSGRRPDDPTTLGNFAQLLLLCTDGLTKHLTDADILAIADRPDPTTVITRRLADTALADGGSDNITVVVARYEPRRSKPVASSVTRSSSRGRAGSPLAELG